MGKSRSRDPFHNQLGSGAAADILKSLAIKGFNYLRSPHGRTFIKNTSLKAIKSKPFKKIINNTSKYLMKKIEPKTKVNVKKKRVPSKKIGRKNQKGGGHSNEKNISCSKKSSKKTRKLTDLFVD